MCNICKSEDYKAKNCPFPWSRAVPSVIDAHVKKPDDAAPQSSDLPMATQDAIPDLPSPDDPMEEDNGKPSDKELFLPHQDDAEDANNETDHTLRFFSGRTGNGSSVSLTNPSPSAPAHLSHWIKQCEP